MRKVRTARTERKSKTSAQKVEVAVITRAAIYRAAVAHFAKRFQQYSAVDAIASAMGMSTKMLYSVLEGYREMKARQEEEFFRICHFPQGYDLKKEFVFPETNHR